jgi:hypothetical protein
MTLFMYPCPGPVSGSRQKKRFIDLFFKNYAGAGSGSRPKNILPFFKTRCKNKIAYI